MAESVEKRKVVVLETISITLRSIDRTMTSIHTVIDHLEKKLVKWAGLTLLEDTMPTPEEIAAAKEHLERLARENEERLGEERKNGNDG
jgi:hypothetical protein